MHAILIATAALAGLPILLHLLMKQEPKRLPFPALRFLILKKKTNQRKMKLRHFLLLALRVLLIALFGLALFQPRLAPTGLAFGITLSGEEPVAAVIIVDTSPSMGYIVGKQSRLQDAVTRALELLDDLPANSKVMVLDPSRRVGDWEKSIADARAKLEGMKEPSGAAVPVTAALATAYEKLKEFDSTGKEPMPRLVAVFSDRTAACWKDGMDEELKMMLKLVPPPEVAHLFVDVGLDSPVDVGIDSITFEQQVVPMGQPVELDVAVRATGPAAEAMLNCRVLPAAGAAFDVPAVRVAIAAGGKQAVRLLLPESKLKPGLHQIELKLEKSDNLLFNDTRYATFKVAEPKKILTISDDPDDAKFWQLAHESKGDFQCVIAKPAALPKLAEYDAIALLGVTDPTKLWPELLKYVEAGGQLILLPCSESQVLPSAYRAEANEAAAKLLPADLSEVYDAKFTLPAPYDGGLAWRLDDASLRKPFLAPFAEWKNRGNIDVIVTPPRAWKFWTVKPRPGASVLAYYDSGDEAKDPPAVLERVVGKGRVLLLTTRLDSPRKEASEKWNDYWSSETTWMLVLPNLLGKYCLGSMEKETLNFLTGLDNLRLPLPRGGATKLTLNGPGVRERDATIAIDPESGPPILARKFADTAGSFRVIAGDWRDGFSLNPPPEENNLEKASTEMIEGVLGEGSIVTTDRKTPLREILKLKYNQPLELFPWLLILVLLLLVIEAYVANRFYRRRQE